MFLSFTYAVVQSAWHQQFKRAAKINRTAEDGTVFDSTTELDRWYELLFEQQMGRISDLKRQVAFKLILPCGTPIRTPKGLVARYTADFTYIEKGQLVVEDVKGFVDKTAQLRMAVVEAIYKIKIRITRKKK